MGTRGISESRMVWGALRLLLPLLQHLSLWWYLPDFLKVKKERLNNVPLFLLLLPQLDRILGMLCSRPLSTLA